MRRSMKGKRAKAVSIIGGADGPTSVFITGKSKKTSFAEGMRQKRYWKKRARVEASIMAGARTLEEVIRYLKEAYGAVEMSKEAFSYVEQRKCLKESLILRYRPQLLREAAIIPDLEAVDEESFREWKRQFEFRSEAAEAVSEEQFPMDFHLYKVSACAGLSGQGQIEFSIELNWNVLQCSFSGQKEDMEKLRNISKDVYSYYGVSREDIQNKTERYQSLVTILCGFSD